MKIGDTVGQYRIEEELGRGTYGVVFRGVHTHMHEIQAAVKAVHPSLSKDPTFVSALQKECQLLNSLTHPGIVGFKTLEVTDEGLAVLLELLEGKDLYEVIKAGPTSVAEVERMATRLLEALSYAHDRKVVHRDIKPSNAFLCNDGTVKVMDFGVSRAADGTKASQTGQIVGTFDYMAPDAFEGKVTPAVDVYAIGLVMWELLTGRIACPDGSLARKMRWHCDEELADVRALRPDCPAWMAEFIRRLVAKDPKDRPKDGKRALEVMAELKAHKGSFVSLRSNNESLPPPGTVMPHQAKEVIDRQRGVTLTPTVASEPVAEPRPEVHFPPQPQGQAGPSTEWVHQQAKEPPKAPENKAEKKPEKKPEKKADKPVQVDQAPKAPVERKPTTSPGGGGAGRAIGVVVALGAVLFLGVVVVGGGGLAVYASGMLGGGGPPPLGPDEVGKEMVAMPAGGVDALRSPEAPTGG